jgi:hypothetical protein
MAFLERILPERLEHENGDSVTTRRDTTPARWLPMPRTARGYPWHWAIGSLHSMIAIPQCTFAIASMFVIATSKWPGRSYPFDIIILY